MILFIISARLHRECLFRLLKTFFLPLLTTAHRNQQSQRRIEMTFEVAITVFISIIKSSYQIQEASLDLSCKKLMNRNCD